MTDRRFIATYCKYKEHHCLNNNLKKTLLMNLDSIENPKRPANDKRRLT